MNSYHDELKGFEYANTSSSTSYNYVNIVNKPLELYVFVDPLCAESWSLEPYLKKLRIEYGRFFTIRPIIGGHLNSNNYKPFHKPRNIKQIWDRTILRTGMACNTQVWDDNPDMSSSTASLAIKAAELQGKKAGREFLRKVQESVFLRKKNVSNERVLLECAQDVNIDIDEFNKDLNSEMAQKALASDFNLTEEMDVEYIPTLVFFDQTAEQPGIKISGLYPYDIYVQILSQIRNKPLIPSSKPPLEVFLSYYNVVTTKEVAVVYDWSWSKTEQELKKLQIRQKVIKTNTKNGVIGVFWEYLKHY